MTDTVSIIRLEGEPLSVEAEKKRHSDWVKQEAQLLMDELFIDLHQSASNDGDSEPMDVDWVEGHLLASSNPTSDATGLTPSWQSLKLDESRSSEDDVSWVSQSETTPFYQRMLMILGGLAVITPLSVWGGNVLKVASQKSVIAATPLPGIALPSLSDKDFANYADQALQKIEAKPRSEAQAVGITTLPALKIGETPSALPPVAAIPPTPKGLAKVQPPASLTPAQTNLNSTPASPEELNRLALRVFEPEPIRSAVPPLSKAQSETSQPATQKADVSTHNTLPEPSNFSNITPAPASDLPSLSANVSAPSTTVAAATPMNSPANANKKVIGIVELGLQSTLMVSNNGSHLNFQVGDTVDDSGWKLVQITQGKAILQKGTEYKSLSEGQYF